MQIVTEKRTDPTGTEYWIAYRADLPDNYSLGNTKAQAVHYLKQAIALRTDIFG